MAPKKFDRNKSFMQGEYVYCGDPVYEGGKIKDFVSAFVRKKEIKSIEPFYYQDNPEEEACWVYLYKDRCYLVEADSESLLNFINDLIL